MKKNFCMTFAFALLALLLGMGSAQASFVPPGTVCPPTCVPPDVATVGLPGFAANFVTSTGGTVSTTSGGATLTITYTESVWAETTPLCPGCLDFVIQAVNDSVATPGTCIVNGLSSPSPCAKSNQILDHVTTGDYSVLTGPLDLEMAQNSGGNFTAGGSLPALTLPVPTPSTLVQRPVGAAPEFDFGLGVPVGGQTEYLILKTDVTSYTTGTVSFQDTVTATGAGFAPAPEPRMIGFLLLGFACVVFMSRRRKSIA